MSAPVPVRRGQPSIEDVHIDAALSNIAVAFFQTSQEFIYDKVFPSIDVEHKTDVYWTFPKDAWLRDEAKKRAPSTESAGSGFTTSTASYNADVWAFHKDLDKQTLANADDGLSLESATITYVASRLGLRQERQWATDYFGTSIWGTDFTGAVTGNNTSTFTYWSDAASDPVMNLDQLKQSMLLSTGLEPNTLVLGYEVYRQLRRHPDFIDRVKYTSTDSVSLDMLKKFLEVENIYVARAVVNTANEGAAASLSFIHGKSAWFGHVATNPSRLTPSAGYTFRWTGVSGSLGIGAGVQTIDMPLIKSTRYEMEVAFDNKIVSGDLGVFLSAIVL